MFGEDENRMYLKIRAVREKLMDPLAQILVDIGVTPDVLSYLGLAMMLPFVYFFGFNPWISFIFLLLHVFLDMLDGVVARKLKKSSAWGGMLDYTVDYTSFVIIFFTFLYYQVFSPFWGALFIFSYTLMHGFLLYMSMKKMHVFFIMKMRLWFYFFILIWVASGLNFFDPFLVVTTVYFLVTNFFLYNRIRCSL